MGRPHIGGGQRVRQDANLYSALAELPKAGRALRSRHEVGRNEIEFVQRSAKRLLQALQKNLERYEERFGTIDISSDDDPVFHYPNEIGATAWKGWVQERGTYFIDAMAPPSHRVKPSRWRNSQSRLTRKRQTGWIGRSVAGH